MNICEIIRAFILTFHFKVEGYIDRCILANLHECIRFQRCEGIRACKRTGFYKVSAGVLDTSFLENCCIAAYTRPRSRPIFDSLSIYGPGDIL